MDWKEFIRPTKYKVLLFFLIPVFYAQFQMQILCFAGPCPQPPPTYLFLPLILAIFAPASSQPNIILQLIGGSIVSYLLSSWVVFLYHKLLTASRKNILKGIFKPTWGKWLLLGTAFYLSIMFIGTNFNQTLVLLPLVILAFLFISSMKIQHLWLKLGLIGWLSSYLLILLILLFSAVRGVDDYPTIMPILWLPTILLNLFSPVLNLIFPNVGPGVVFIFAPYSYLLIGALIGCLIKLKSRWNA